jgi:hypothetical protein
VHKRPLGAILLGQAVGIAGLGVIGTVLFQLLGR